MAIPISKFMGLRPKSVSSGNLRPRLNETYISSSRYTHYGISNKLQQKKRFWEWFKQRPELNSPVSIRVNDTITSVDFYSLDGTALGRNKRKEAERDFRNNFIIERLKSIWFDSIITGSGFGWKGFVNPENDKIKQIIDSYSDFYSAKVKLKESNETIRFALKQALDEDLRKPRVFDYIPSSTVEINFDDREILGYTQYTTSGDDVVFSPKEVIHFKFQSIDGKVDGYSPVQSLTTEMILLYFIKENMISYIRNGGNPNKIYVLEDEIANSPNHQFLQDLLMNQGMLENRHGNLVLTGNVKVQELEEKMKDMEYENLDLLITSNIAYSLQIPISRIPYMIGKSQSNGDAGGLAESGYWSMIDSDQTKIENLMNSQYFLEKGYMMKFRRHYKIDDLREVQALGMKADAIQKTQSIFNTYGIELTPQKIITMMDLREEDTQKMSKEKQAQRMMPKPMLSNQLSNDNMENPDKQKKNDTKRQAALNNPKGVDQGGY